MPEIAMSPFLGIALSLLPDLAKRLTRRGKPETRAAVIGAVQDVLGTADAREAQARAAEPDLSNALRLRLAEIESDEAAAEMAERELARQAELERLRLDIAGAANARADAADARDLLTGLTRDRSVIAWGPVVVSAVVVLGFFATLLYLINGGLSPDRLLPPDPGSQFVNQIVNIAVGTLTAGFATVISFWLGSSDGSRRKDVSLAQAQQAQQVANRETARQTREIVTDQSRQTAEIVRQIAPEKPESSVPLSAKPNNFAACMAVVLEHEELRRGAPRRGPRPVRFWCQCRAGACRAHASAHRRGYGRRPDRPEDAGRNSPPRVRHTHRAVQR